jgi:hypothetical protein
MSAVEPEAVIASWHCSDLPIVWKARMNTKNLNQWLTLGANLGVLIGIILLIAELNQNSTLMRAQIFNDRTDHGIAQFMTMAESSELSEIDALLLSSGFPENATAFSELTEAQKHQYYWLIRADRYRVENLLYQQSLGILENDLGPVISGRSIIKQYEAMNQDDLFRNRPLVVDRLRKLVSDSEERLQQNH